MWSYEKGEHVSLIGPTGSGKTTLSYQLLQHTATTENPAVVLVMKPKDFTVKHFSKQAGYRTVPVWPPTPSIWQPGKKPGYVLWPKHSFDPDVDDERHYGIFRHAILDSYRRGNRIIFADEAYSLVNELGLERELITIWSKGRSMNTGLWAATQKPTHVPLWMYSQPEHLFLAYDPDRRARERFSEIGGVDPDLVKSTVMELAKHEWLYIHRAQRAMCVVGK
jgi:hypothetical protein